MNRFKRLIMLLVLFTGLAISNAKAADLGNGFTLSNVTYLDFTNATGDHFDPSNPNNLCTGVPCALGALADKNKGQADGFHFTRVYLTLKKQISDDLMVRITTDQMTVRPDGTHEGTPFGLSGFAGDGRGNIFIKYAYGEYSVNPNLKVRLGLSMTPWIDEAENRWTLRFLRPTYWDEQGALISSDLGVAVLGSAFDKMITYHLMVSNGEGYQNNAVNGQGDAVQGRVDLNLGGFTLSAFGLTGSAMGDPNCNAALGSPYGSTTNATCGATTPNVSGWNEDREIFYIQYADPMFRISAEYMMANDEVTGDGVGKLAVGTSPTLGTSTGYPRFNQGRGMGAWAWTKIPGFESARLFGRYYAMTPNSTTDAGKMTEINAGIAYEVTSGLTIALDDTMITQTLMTTAPTTVDFSDSIIGLRAQLSF